MTSQAQLYNVVLFLLGYSPQLCDKKMPVVLCHLHTSFWLQALHIAVTHCIAGILGEGGRYELLKLEQRFPEAKNSGLVRLSCFLSTVVAFWFLLGHLHLWFAQHSPFRWRDLYLGQIHS